MKLILAILFAAFAASAQVPQETVNNWMLMAVPNSGPCSTYNTTNAWDNFIEGFQTTTTGYESNGWTAFGTTANIYPATDTSSLGTYKPAGACSQALKIIAPNNGAETYAFITNNIDLDAQATDVTFSFYVASGTVSAGADYAIFRYYDYVAAAGTRVYLTETSGNLGIYPYGTTIFATNTISADTWYTCVLSLDAAQAVGGSSLKLFSNGSQVGTTTAFRRPAADIGVTRVGFNFGLDAGETGTIYYDIIAIKTY